MSVRRAVGFVGPIAGPGPVFPVLGGASLTFTAAAAGFAGSSWHGEKVLRVQASGCYGYQVDGTDFSAVIVFRADVR